MARTNQIKAVSFEALENRTMMSAAPMVHAAAVNKVVSTPVHLIKTVNPTTTSKQITYKSFASDPLFASTGPSINDITQGDLGDCYLLSTLSSVAKTDPSLIQNDIVADGYGVYSVKFGGAHGTMINVSADLPVFPNGQLAYAQLGTQNCTWVAVMEKAYVQYTHPKSDAYASINGGWMGTVFSALGLSSQSLFTASSAASFLVTLQQDLNAGDFVTYGTQNQLPTSSPLVAGHAYEVDSVTDNAKGTPVSVTLRNPWGNEVANDGFITVTAQDAFTAFSGVVISHS